MNNQKIEILKARLQGIISTVDSASDISNHISLTLSNDFNNILKEFCNAFPEHKDSFPEPIPSKFGRRLGVADSSFLDLRTKAEQVVKIVEVISADR